MFEQFTQFLDAKVSTPMAKLAEQKHLRAVRDGIIAALPLIIAGSFFLIIANPPFPESWSIYQFLKSNAVIILLPFRMTMYIMSLYAAWAIGHSLSKSYNLDALTGATLAAMGFLLTFTPINVPAEAALRLVGEPETANVFSGLALPMGNLGGSGMFIAIIVSILSVEIYRVIQNSKFKITMPAQVPSSVARSFEALTPVLAIMLTIGSLTYFVGLDWHAVVSKAVAPIVKAADSLPSVITISSLNSFFWCFGIHGSSVVGSLARPLWLNLLDMNTIAQAAGTAGTALPAIAAEPFYQWFIYIGGSGCTIGLSFCMLVASKSKYLKSLGKAVAVPSLFNINEPVIFGTPIVLNPVLMIPFVLAPAVTGTVAWVATNMGLVNRVVVTAPWTLPGPIGAFIATGGDYRASILCLVCIAISIIIFFPFFKIYDNNMLREEKEADDIEQAQAPTSNI